MEGASYGTCRADKLYIVSLVRVDHDRPGISSTLLPSGREHTVSASVPHEEPLTS